jgi:hypothetical protein
MTIKQQGGIFGRNPTFNDVTVDGDLSGVKATLSTSDYGQTANSNADELVIEFTNKGGISFLGPEALIFFGDDADDNAGRISYKHSTNELAFVTAASTAATFNSSGNLAFPSGQGIDFSATSGTGTSELFDDYEEGVHTTTITPTTSGTISMPSSNNQLAYTKIGNVVHVSGYLYVSAVSSPTGAFDISLPFTAADLQDKGGDSPASLWLTNINGGANVADFVGTVSEGASALNVRLGDGVTANEDSAQQIKAGTQIKISVTYKAA